MPLHENPIHTPVSRTGGGVPVSAIRNCTIHPQSPRLRGTGTNPVIKTMSSKL